MTGIQRQGLEQQIRFKRVRVGKPGPTQYVASKVVARTGQRAGSAGGFGKPVVDDSPYGLISEPHRKLKIRDLGVEANGLRFTDSLGT
ncbi:MAG: hypothetical protein AAGA23_20655, partial [Pseudomonadota bacterium]